MPHVKGTHAVNYRDLTGQAFGRLTVTERAGSKIFPKGNIMAQWKCQCSCGSEPIIVLGNNLKRGNTTSCGCYQDERRRQKADKAATWKGGRQKNRRDGYVLVYVHGTPDEQYQRRSAKTPYELEHVIVMSKHLGRVLDKFETVHHINGIRDDNRLENLELWSNRHPYGQRIEDKVKWAKEIIELYEPNWRKDDEAQRAIRLV
jgi:hypothetical protein